jgi:hypothetical protein
MGHPPYSRNNPLKYIDPSGKYFVISSENTTAMQYISTLLRSDAGRALVNSIAADPRPTIIFGGRLPNERNSDGSTSFTNGQTAPLLGANGQLAGTTVELDPVNAALTSALNGKGADFTGLDAFTHELFHVSDENQASDFAAAVLAGQAGDAPDASGPNNTTGGTAEQRALAVLAGLASTSYTPDQQSDAQAQQIINNGNQQFQQNATQQLQEYLKKLWSSGVQQQ